MARVCYEDLLVQAHILCVRVMRLRFHVAVSLGGKGKYTGQCDISACLGGQDTSWLDRHLGDIPHVIYQIDAPDNVAGARHRVPQFKGGLALVYIQFIVDYYKNLPKSVLFITGRRYRPGPGS